MEETMRKEEEKRKRLAEEREREAERLRKQKEKEERARLEREAREKERKVGTSCGREKRFPNPCAQEKEEKERLAKEAKERQQREEKARKAAEEEARKEKARKEKEEREVKEKEAQAAAQAQAAARLAAQQQAAAKKNAAIASQQQQQVKGPKAARVPATRQKSNTPRSSTPAANLVQPSAAAPVVTPSLASASNKTGPSARPPVANNAIRPNVPPLAMQGSQGMPQQAHMNQSVPPQMMPPMFSPSGSMQHMHNMPPSFVNGNMPHSANRQNMYNPQGMHAKGGPSSVGQNPFPPQGPAFASPRHMMNNPGAASGYNPSFGQAGINPSTNFGNAAPGQPSQVMSPEGRNASEQSAPSPFDLNVVGGMRTLGLGHPAKMSGKPTEDVFSPATSIGQSVPLRSHSDQTTPVLTATTPDFRSAFSRPDPIGPIEPIGRPRIANGFDTIDESAPLTGALRKPSPPVTSGQALGSAALSAGAEEVKDIPAPRRVSNTAALGGTWAPPSLSTSTSWGPSPFAMTPGAGIWGGSTTTSQVDAPHWPTGGSTNNSPFGKGKMASTASQQSTLTRGFNPVISGGVAPEPPSSTSAFFSPMQTHHSALPTLNPFGPPGQTPQLQQQSVHHTQHQPGQPQQPQQRLL